MARTRNAFSAMQASPVREKVADVTYLRTSEGRFSVAAAIDLFPRRVAGWSMSDQMTSQIVTEALIMAILHRSRPQELLRQSDQGVQHTGEPIQRLMADQGVTRSMSRPGIVWDNAAMESFFSYLKTERVRRNPAGPENSRAPICSMTSSGSPAQRAVTRPLANQAP